MTPFFKANNLFFHKGGALVTNKSSVLNGPLHHHCFVFFEKLYIKKFFLFLFVFIIFFKEWNVRRLTSFVSTNSVGRNFHE